MLTHETTIECCGRGYHTEIKYEIDGDGDITLYKIEMSQQVNKNGGVWYDRNGNPHFGDTFIYLDVTEWLDATQKKEFIDEIMAHKIVQQMAGEEEKAYDRAFEKWLNGNSHQERTTA